ncbi:hypothetical protein ABFA07_009680 [Porites harrisoni]
MATKRQSYTTSEKLKIIQFAEEHGNRAAQREFGIAESNVRLWRKSKENRKSSFSSVNLKFTGTCNKLLY